MKQILIPFLTLLGMLNIHFAQASGSQWCDQTLEILNQAKMNAEYHQVRGNFNQASYILYQGLKQAAQNTNSYSPQFFTVRTIQRGITLVETLRPLLAGESNAPATMLFVLLSYYDLVAFAAYELDIPYWIPYSNCKYCQSYDPYPQQNFFAKFSEFSRMQLNWVRRNLANEAYFPGMPSVIPIGAPIAFIKALSLASGFAAQDLSESLYRVQWSCVIRDLQYLRTFMNDQSYDEVYRVQRGYQEASQIISALTYSGCGRY